MNDKLQNVIDTLPEDLLQTGVFVYDNQFCAVGWMAFLACDQDWAKFAKAPAYNLFVGEYYGLNREQVRRIIYLNDIRGRDAVLEYLRALVMFVENK